MATWVTDARHLPPAHAEHATPAGARRTGFMHEIIEAATSRRIEGAWCSAVRCIARVGRKACGSRVHVTHQAPGRIEWSCPSCGEDGVLTGFVGTEHDLSPYIPRSKKLRLWGFDDEGREVLRAATTGIAPLRAVIARAYPAQDVPGLLLVQATIDELDDIYTLVEHLSDRTRGRRRLELLDGMRFGLSTAMDGF